MRRSLPLLLLAEVALFLSTGCRTVSIARDFSPRSGDVCDQVAITGDNLHLGRPTITFSGVPAQFVWDPTEPSTTPTVLRATIPAGATTGPLRVRIDMPWNIFLAEGSDVVLGDFTVTGSPAPTIGFFTATPAEIEAGSSTTLNWSASGHTALTLDGASVFGTTTQTVTLAATRSYTLAATNRCVTQSRSVTVRVNPPPFLNPISGTRLPGTSLTVTGRGLTRSTSPTTLVFTQGTMSVPLTPSPASATSLTATIPSTFMRGTATVQARIGTLMSNSVTLQLGGYQNGQFREVTDFTSTSVTCGTRTLAVSGSGSARQALFTEGTRTLEVIDFVAGPLAGAAFSPGCANAVVVTHVDTSTAQLIVQPFRSGAAPFNTFTIRTDVPERWHALFSPDDSLLLATAGTSSGSSQPLTLTLGNLDTSRGTTDYAGCRTLCSSVSAAVTSSAQVQINVDGAALPPMPIP